MNVMMNACWPPRLSNISVILCQLLMLLLRVMVAMHIHTYGGLGSVEEKIQNKNYSQVPY